MDIIDFGDDLKGQYCNRNCIGCSTSSLATAGLYCLLSCFITRCTTDPQQIEADAA